MSATAKIPAGDVEERTTDWGDFEVLIPDALTDPGPPPVYEPTWMGVEAIDTGEQGDVIFVIAGDPSVRWLVPVDRVVEVRMGL